MKKTRFILTLFIVLAALSTFCFAKTHKEDIDLEGEFSYTLEENDKVSCNLYVDETGLWSVQIVGMSSTGTREPDICIEILRDGEIIYSFMTDEAFDRDGEFKGDKFYFYTGLTEGEYKVNIENRTLFGDVTFKLHTFYDYFEYTELAPNNSFETATPMEPGEEYFGGNTMSDEMDFFSFDMKEDGYAYLSFYSEDIKYFFLYDEKENQIGNVDVKIDEENKVYEIRACLAKGKYYIGVVPLEDYSLPLYSLEMKAYFGDDFEREYNNDFDSATTIEYGKEYQGNLFGISDVDIYKFEIANKSEAMFEFSDKKVSKEAHYSVVISDGEEDIYENNEQFSGKASLTLEKGTYYIIVTSRGNSSFTTMAYGLSISNVKKVNTADKEDNTDSEAPKENITSFSDVIEGKWYYNSVTEAAKLGLVEGVGGGKYNPHGNVTTAEAITMAVRVYVQKNQIQNEFSIQKGDKWYSAYVGFAKDIGMIDKAFSDFERPATRAEVAHFFAAALGKAESTDYIADMDYLKSLDILKGDSDGQMHPERNLTRAEAATILLRVHELIAPIN